MLCPRCGYAAGPAVTLAAAVPSGTAGACGVAAVPDMGFISEQLHALQTGGRREAFTQRQPPAVGKPVSNVCSTHAVGAGADPIAAQYDRSEVVLPESKARNLAWCRNDGLVGVLRLPTSNAGGAGFDTRSQNNESAHHSEGHGVGIIDVEAVVQMHAQTFSAPVAFGHFIVMGCRDDHLYCLHW